MTSDSALKNRSENIRATATVIVGFALFFLASAAFAKSVVQPQATISFIPLCFYGTAILLGATVALLARRGMRHSGDIASPLLAGAILTIGCLIWGVFPSIGYSPDGIGMAIPAILISAGGTLLLIAWGRVLTGFEPRHALFVIACSYGLGTSLGLLITILPGSMTLPCACLLASNSSVALLPRAPRTHALNDDDRNSTPPSGTGEHAPKDPLTTADEATSFLWKPIVASALCAFISGTSAIAGSGGALGPIALNATGTFIASCLLIGVIRIPGPPFSPYHFYRTAIPLAAIVVLCIPLLIGDADGAASIAINMLGVLGFALLDIAIIAALPMAARTYGISSDLLFGLTRALGAAFLLLGSATHLLVGTETMRSICAIATAIYLGGIVMSLARAGEHVVDPERIADDRSPSLEQACDELSRRGGLSPRETQVLSYLARGRGSTFIGDELCISAQTVKAHTRHIYEKLGVHSREELLDLFGGLGDR